MQKKIFCFLLLLFFVPATDAYAQTALPAYFATYESDVRALIANSQKQNDAERLQELFKTNWDYLMRDNPEWATDVGYPGLNDMWMDLSVTAFAKRRSLAQLTLETIQSIDRNKIPGSEHLNYDLFLREAKLDVEAGKFPEEYLQITQLDGVFQDAIQFFEAMPAANVEDYRNMLKRMERLPALFDQAIELLKSGLVQKITPPKIALRDVPEQIQSQIVDDPWKSPVLLPFKKFPHAVAVSDRATLKSEAAQIYKTRLKPAFQKYHDFIADTYIPGARESTALLDVPNGRDWYALKVREETTTDLTPDEIHQIGLNEVRRIRGEMEKIRAELKFPGSLADFFNHLRTDPKFFFGKRAQLLSAYRNIAKRIDPELVKLFGTLPRLPYGIKPVPRYAEKSQTTAYYWPGSLKAGRAGYFYANTYDLKSRPKWEMEALTLHEAVPGHHFQIALARELEGLPEFRKEGDYTAFIEGWGLYAESLGGELGLYKNPYSRFGQLTYEMWRAIRLVVDTGLHAKGWTRQQAINFFTENAGKAGHDIVVEVDRYIVWPGQALAYKIGELELKKLRADCAAKLGQKFDVREFHDQVLNNGPLPLDFLESRIRAWTEKQSL